MSAEFSHYDICITSVQNVIVIVAYMLTMRGKGLHILLVSLIMFL